MFKKKKLADAIYFGKYYKASLTTSYFGIIYLKKKPYVYINISIREYFTA